MLKIMLKSTVVSGLVCLPVMVCAEGLLGVNNPAKNGFGTGIYADYNGTSQSLRGEAGAQWGGYRIGVLSRGEAMQASNADTLYILGKLNTGTSMAIGNIYRLDGRIRSFRADGVRLSKSFNTPLRAGWEMDWGGGVSYLRGKRIEIQTVTGQITSISAGNADFVITHEETDSKASSLPSFLGAPYGFSAPFGLQKSPSGQGYALDVGMVLRHNSGLRAELAVNDLAGRMEWKNLPTYKESCNPCQVQNGLPPTSGFSFASSYQDMTQKLEPKMLMSMSYPVGHFEVQGATSYTSDSYSKESWFPQAGLTYRFSEDWAVNTDYDFRFRSVGVALQQKWFYLGVRTEGDNVNLENFSRVSGGVNIAF